MSASAPSLLSRSKSPTKGLPFITRQRANEGNSGAAAEEEEEKAEDGGGGGVTEEQVRDLTRRLKLNTELHIAAELGGPLSMFDDPRVTAADLTSTDHYLGKTPLHLAVEGAHATAVAAILDAAKSRNVSEERIQQKDLLGDAPIHTLLKAIEVAATSELGHDLGHDEHKHMMRHRGSSDRSIRGDDDSKRRGLGSVGRVGSTDSLKGEEGKLAALLVTLETLGPTADLNLIDGNGHTAFEIGTMSTTVEVRDFIKSSRIKMASKHEPLNRIDVTVEEFAKIHLSDAIDRKAFESVARTATRVCRHNGEVGRDFEPLHSTPLHSTPLHSAPPFQVSGSVSNAQCSPSHPTPPSVARRRFRDPEPECEDGRCDQGNKA